MKSKNNSSRKSTKKKFSKNKYYLVLGIAVIIVILLFILLVKSLFDYFSPSYYSIKPRSNNIEKREAMKKTDANYDVVGWIRVQGTKIDFPVVMGKDDTFKRPVESTAYGWLGSKSTSGKNNVLTIFGHNIMNLSTTPLVTDDSFERFEELLAYTDYDFAQKNLYFQYTVDGEDYLYKIFAVSFMIPQNLFGLPKGDFSKDQVASYIEMVKENSIYNYDVKVTSDDKIISLVTCTNIFAPDEHYNDVVITGKRVTDGERKGTYSVSKTSKYNDLEKVMKGDVNNE